RAVRGALSGFLVPGRCPVGEEHGQQSRPISVVEVDEHKPRDTEFVVQLLGYLPEGLPGPVTLGDKVGGALDARLFVEVLVDTHYQRAGRERHSVERVAIRPVLLEPRQEVVEVVALSRFQGGGKVDQSVALYVLQTLLDR